MKSEIGRKLQEIMDRRGVTSANGITVWIVQENPETGEKTIIGYGGKPVIDHVKRRAQTRRSKKGKRSK